MKTTEKIVWTTNLETAFTTSQAHLRNNRTVAIPTASDKLWIVTDGAVKSPGIGATLYTQQAAQKPKLAGFFSMKLKENQTRWMPCEIEAWP